MNVRNTCINPFAHEKRPYGLTAFRVFSGEGGTREHLNQVQRLCLHCCFRAVAHFQLTAQVVDVRLGRPRADDQLLGNLAIRQSRCDQAHLQRVVVE